jgi:hypothetical protein
MRLGRTAWIYGFFTTWGVVGTLLVALGATSGPRVLVAAGLVFLSVTLLDVAVLFPILRARRDLRRRRSSDDSI